MSVMLKKEEKDEEKEEKIMCLCWFICINCVLLVAVMEEEIDMGFQIW